jgi:hypothetical protein
MAPEYRLGQYVSAHSSTVVSSSGILRKGEEVQRFFNHKQNKAFLEIQKMGQSNQDLKKQLIMLRKDTVDLRRSQQ